jgi:hypothetical protein
MSSFGDQRGAEIPESNLKAFYTSAELIHVEFEDRFQHY